MLQIYMLMLVNICFIMYLCAMKTFERLPEPECLNIPQRMLKRYVSKEEEYLLLCMSVCIKLNYEDSRMSNVTVEKIRKLLGCEKTLACKLLRMAKNDKFLFTYNAEDKSLTANNFKKRYTRKSTDKYGRDIWCISVVQLKRFNINPTTNEKEKIHYTLRKVAKELRKLLAIHTIGIAERKDKYVKDKVNLFKRETMLTHKKLCVILGLCNTKAVYRLIRELMQEGRITRVKRCELRFIGNYRSEGEETINEKCHGIHTTVIDYRTGSVYEAIPNKYGIVHGHECSRHIILNHKRRLKEYLPKLKPDYSNFDVTYDWYCH